MKNNGALQERWICLIACDLSKGSSHKESKRNCSSPISCYRHQHTDHSIHEDAIYPLIAFVLIITSLVGNVRRTSA